MTSVKAPPKPIVVYGIEDGDLVGIGYIPPGSTTPQWWGTAPGTDTGAGRAVKPKFTGSIGQVQPTDFVPVIYGEQRVEVLINWFTGGTSVHAYGLGIIGDGEISSVDHIFVCDARISAVSGTAPGSRNFTSYLGASTDAIPTDLWPPANYDLSGWAAPRKPAYIRFNFYGDSYGNEPWWSFIPALKNGGGTLTMAADVHGRKIYDPRLDSTNGGSGPQRYATPSTWAYSNNPALVYRDLNVSYGLTPNASMNDAVIRAMADVCDTKGFTCNLAFTNKSSLDNAITSVLQTCCGLRTTTGGIGLWIDVSSPGAGALSVSEEDGSISGVTVQWLSTATRPTQLIIEFNSATLRPSHPAWVRGGWTGGGISGWKVDTFSIDDPRLAGGTVPLRSTTMSIPGISSQSQAQVVGDYYFNLAAISMRLRGTIAFQGVLLTRGTKIHVTTLKGVDNDFLVEQVDEGGEGLYPVVLRPYVEALYVSTPIAIGPPVIVEGPDPFDVPPDVTGATEVDTSYITTNTPTAKTITSYAGVNYGLPDYQWAKRLRVRAMVTWTVGDRDAATWGSMAASEILVPLTGNLPPISDSVFALEMLGVAVASDGFVYNFLGEQIGEVGTRMYSRVIIKLENQSAVLSAGVTLDASGSSWDISSPPVQPDDVNFIARDDITKPKAYWEGPFDYETAPSLGAGGTWSYTGDVTVWNPTKIADGDTGALAIRVYGASAGSASIIVDFGSVPASYVNRFLLNFMSPVTVPGLHELYFSDNGSDWTIANQYGNYKIYSPTPPTNTLDIAWPIGNLPHRYLKIIVGHDAGQTIDISEITFYSASLQACVGGWAIYKYDWNTSTLGDFMFSVPREQMPTRAKQWDVSPAVWTEYDETTGLTYWYTDFAVLAYNERATNLLSPMNTIYYRFGGNYYAYVTRAGS